MLYDNYNNLINKIVWFIPVTKFRNCARKILNDIVNTMYKIEYLFDENNKITKEAEDCIIISFSDGLSCQIAKYLFGEYIKENFARKVKYDITWHIEKGKDAEHKEKRVFDMLNAFPDIDFDIASKEEIDLYKRLFYIDSDKYAITDEILKNRKQLYIDGYFVKYPKNLEETLNKMNFGKYILPKLEGENLSFYNEITAHKASVAVHIRRGDILQHGGFFLDFNKSEDAYFEYILNALSKIKDKLYPVTPKFFFISNDINWVLKNVTPKIKDKYEYRCLEADNAERVYIDMYLISLAKHIIASVGGFAPTANMFNKNKNGIFISPYNIKDL